MRCGVTLDMADIECVTRVVVLASHHGVARGELNLSTKLRYWY